MNSMLAFPTSMLESGNYGALVNPALCELRVVDHAQSAKKTLF